MVNNPLKSHLSDSTFEFLIKNELLREKGVRDFKIRNAFQNLKQEVSTQRAIEILQEEYPYLQHETIRKIIYHKTKINSPEHFYLF
jgi:hypothetical protein